MSQKTIIQRAQGYNGSPVAVTVKIDDAVIYQGEIPTTNQPMPVLPDEARPDLGLDSWSWSVAQDFTGSVNMTIEVHNGAMILFETFFTLSDPPANVAPIGRVRYPRAENNVSINDPLTNVTINGTVQSTPRTADRPGQWSWKLAADDIFSSTVNILPQELPPPEEPQ